ncbi:MAG: LysR family transcriptional regulator [Myxococcota bacterium]
MTSEADRDARESTATLDWAGLQGLDAFGRTGSISGAAEALGVNQTTVSRRIRQLEEQLGCRLLETVSGRLELTSEGRRAAEACQRMGGMAVDMHRELSGHDAELEGVIRVGLLDLHLDMYADALRSFSQLYPAVNLELSSSGSRLHNLAGREVDVVVRVARRPGDTLVGRRVETLESAPYASAELLSRTPTSELPWVGWTSSVGAEITDRWMQDNLRKGQLRARVDSGSAMMRMVRAGLGASILPISYAERHAGLVRIGDAIPGFETDVWILTHRDLSGVERIRRFMAFLADAMKAPGRSDPAP